MKTTGIRDKNNKIIFVGDWVKQYCPCCGKDELGKGEVIERKEGFCIRNYETEIDSPLLAFDEKTGAQAPIEIVEKTT